MIRSQDFANYINENNRRHKEKAAPYNPLTGEGSFSVERTLVEIPDAPFPKIWFPKEMISKSKAMKRFKKYKTIELVLRSLGLEATPENREAFWIELCKERFKYDFEFWAFTTGTVKDKETDRDIPFKLRFAQRKVLKTLERERRLHKPIRIIIVKARQWGGSTLTEFYILWMQLIHHKQWNSVICGHVQSSAVNVRGLYNKILKTYPVWACEGAKSTKDLQLMPFEGSTTIRRLAARNCKITIGTAERPETLRSGDEVCIHLTEVGLWKETRGKKPEDIMQSIVGGVAPIPDSIIVIESTAKGVGNFFHREWIRACNKESSYVPVFVSWFDVEIYEQPILDMKKFIGSLTREEKRMFKDGATLEGINWYRTKSRDLSDMWRMRSEYPSNALEAFQSTGHPRYNLNDVERLRQGCVSPKFIGDISAAAEAGSKEALQNIEFCPEEKGCLKIWKKPDDEKKVSERYLVVLDIGGLSQNADRSVICVIDRYWLSECGIPEVVAEWCGHVEHYKLAWKAAQLAAWYHNALLVIESNTLESKATEGYHGEFILDEIAKYYRNMYARETSSEVVRQSVAKRWGFHTNAATKVTVCDHFEKVLQHDMYYEPCREAVDEIATLEVKDNGSLGAVDGCHDDRFITRAIGLYICYSKMRTPRPITEVGGQNIYLSNAAI